MVPHKVPCVTIISKRCWLVTEMWNHFSEKLFKLLYFPAILISCLQSCISGWIVYFAETCHHHRSVWIQPIRYYQFGQTVRCATLDCSCVELCIKCSLEYTIASVGSCLRCDATSPRHLQHCCRPTCWFPHQNLNKVEQTILVCLRHIIA